MSTLQLSLAIVGGVVLIGIVVYNAWITRRNAPKRAVPEADAAVRREPALDGRLEPGLDAPGGSAALGPGALAPDPLDSAHGHAVDARDALAMPAPHLPERRFALDACIDAIAPLAIEGVVSGDAALAALPRTRRAGSKPFAVEGLPEAGEVWEPPQPGQRYRAFQSGVQLANRTGALNEIEFSEFVMKTQAFADAINAAPDFPDMLHEVARARELDQFASEHDAQLAFVLRARHAAWSPGYVQQHAARLGFVPGVMPGRMVLPAEHEGAAPLLGLGYDTQAALSDDPDQSAVRELTLSLDVAQVPRAEQPFARLRAVAKALGEAMDGVLCDPNGQPLPAMAMEPIAADLEVLYDHLDARELAAGSPQARRVFS